MYMADTVSDTIQPSKSFIKLLKISWKYFSDFMDELLLTMENILVISSFKDLLTLRN